MLFCRLTSWVMALGMLLIAGWARAQEPAAERKPVPRQAEIDAAVNDIRGLFPEAYAATAKPAKKLEIAGTMLKTARDSAKIDASVYALLLMTRDLAIESGNLELAETALQDLSQLFAVNLIELRVEAYTAIAKKTPPLASARTAFVRSALTLIDEAFRQEEFVKAAELLKVLPELARGADDKTLANQLLERRKAGSAFYEQQRVVAPALAAVRAGTATPAQNVEVGRYLCFVRGDWSKGLPLLKQGNDESLKKLVELEAAAPQAPAEQAAIGDRWWDYAEGGPEPQRAMIVRHAAEFYRAALPGLVGVARLRVEKRIAEVPASVASADEPASNLRPAVMTADKVVLWNTHNSFHIDRGAKTANVVLYLDGKEVFRKANIDIPWQSAAPSSATVKLPARPFDRLRVELPDQKADSNGAGLAEIEVLRGKTNLAKDAVATASQTYFANEPGMELHSMSVIDGVTDEGQQMKGFWLLPSKAPGWIELEWTPTLTTPAAKAWSKSLGYPIRRHPASAKPFKGHWYLYYPGRGLCTEANQRCQQMGGHMIIVDTADENRFGLEQSPTGFVWTGAKRDARGDWRWIDGTPLKDPLWAPGEPANFMGVEDLMMLHPTGWCDVGEGHDRARGFICEWPF